MTRVVHYSDLETALDDPDRTAAFARTVADLRDEDAVVVGTGDDTAPGALSLATDGRGVLALFRTLGPDVDVFGNHDFDFGPETARELAADAPQTWLCANAHRHGERFAPEATEPRVLLSAGDREVGVVGVAHPDTATMSPSVGDVRFTDPVPAVREGAAALRKRGADDVVVASHCGRLDERIARETGVDAVLGGHVHDVHRDRVGDTVVARPGRAARHVLEVDLDEGTATVHDVEVPDDGLDPDLDPDSDGTAPSESVVDPTDPGAVGRAVRRRLREHHAEHGLDEVVATAGEPVDRSEAATDTAGSPVGNFLTDALRWRADADVAISPPGAIRSGDPLYGEVTVGDLVGLAPYVDELLTVAVSGERLREALVAVPFGYHDDGHPNRYCCHVSGAHLVWDDAEGRLERVTVDDDAVSPGERYEVAVADYLVETDHVIGAIDEDDVVATHGRAHDAVVEYARAVGLSAPDERRVRRPALDV